MLNLIASMTYTPTPSVITQYSWYDKLLWPFKWVIAWIMVIIHRGLELIGIPDGAGVGWILTIVLLTIIVRAAIFPLFTKQIKSQRAMQLIQPEMKKLQARYKGKNDPVSRQNMQKEMMALYKEHGTSPFASCLPILVQIPLIGALFRVLAATAGLETGDYPFPHLGGLDKAQAIDINRTKLFGAYMVETFSTTPNFQTQVVIVVLIIIMAVTQFWMMRQLTMKNMPAAALEGPQAQMQKTMMYLMPLMIGVFGFFMQVGLLIYMLTSNVFTVGQQVWAINRMPTPGSEAYRVWQKKQQAKYDKYRAQVVSEYEEKEATAALESPEAASEVRLERERVLRDKRIKLGLENPPKASDKTGAEEESIRVQPTKKTRAQRKAEARANSDEMAEAGEDTTDPTLEEIERRRAERRAAQRARKAKLRAAKKAERARRIRKQGRRPGDLDN